jgi:hypothetical protein
MHELLISAKMQNSRRNSLALMLLERHQHMLHMMTLWIASIDRNVMAFELAHSSLSLFCVHLNEELLLKVLAFKWFRCLCGVTALNGLSFDVILLSISSHLLS